MNLFDMIARPYAWFYQYQVRGFEKNIPAFLDSLPRPIESVLDVGCGTGAMCEVFLRRGLTVEGCDQSQEMLRQAERLTNDEIKYRIGDVVQGLPYPDQSFDLVIASYVAHGLSVDQRKRLYDEMDRIAKKYVVLYDYSPKRHPVSDFLERLENGDYFSFIQVIDEELLEYFGNLTKLPCGSRAFWYKMEKM
ncbi:MAG: class I SAM-dependent methyltransferase [Erysipelotrichaceae bacterium]